MLKSVVGPPHILVAAGDSSTTQRLVTLLDEFGYPHVLVEDDESARRFLTAPQPPGIALIDEDLGSTASGLQLIHFLRQRNHQTQTWLMLIGSEASTGGVRIAAEIGADDFILKPINYSDLRVRLRIADRVQVLNQRVRAESEAARFNANHDSLTGLPSRENAFKQLFRETDRAHRMKIPLAYLLIDLDAFSLINRNYGCSVGDEILRELGQRLRRYLRTYDVVGRYSGDEFLIGLPGCTIERQLPVAERIRNAVLGRPFDIGKERVIVSASVGVAQSLGRSPLAVIRILERALARAKMEGRNCIREAAEYNLSGVSITDSNAHLMLLPDSDWGEPN